MYTRDCSNHAQPGVPDQRRGVALVRLLRRPRRAQPYLGMIVFIRSSVIFIRHTLIEKTEVCAIICMDRK